MDDAQVDELLGKIQGTWSKLSLRPKWAKGKWNPDIEPMWRAGMRRLDYVVTKAVVEDYFAEVLKPRSQKGPSFGEIAFEVRRRRGVRTPVEMVTKDHRPIRLPMFQDGDYVFLTSPFLPAKHLPGGRVRKQEHGDCIEEIPLYLTNAMGMEDGYHLLSRNVTNPVHLQCIYLMNETQRANWIAEMDHLEREGRLSKFSKRRGQ